MDALTIAFVTATTALFSAVLGPVMTFIVSARQIRASVISSNRERWLEALRDSVAEYVGLLLTAAMIKQGTEDDTNKAVAGDRDLRQIVERIVVVKNKIMLLTNPTESRAVELCDIVERTYQALASQAPQAIATMRSEADAITRAGREVLRAEWSRVKRGE
jgi:hypothetical protein